MNVMMDHMVVIIIVLIYHVKMEDTLVPVVMVTLFMLIITLVKVRPTISQFDIITELLQTSMNV